MRRIKLLTAGLIMGLIITALCFAKQDRPELWEEVYREGNTVWSVEVNHIVVESSLNCYMFLLREYNPKKGYRIYSCDAYIKPNETGLSWYLRWQGSEKTDKRAALPVEPKYYNSTINMQVLPFEYKPLKAWQQAVIKYVKDEVTLHPEFVTFCRDIDHAPLLPNYPYHNGMRR